MGELIELLIRAIVSMIENANKAKQPAANVGRALPPPLPPIPVKPGKSRRVAAAMSPPRAVQRAAAPAAAKPVATPTARPLLTAPASASAIAKWARPATLRSQFILTEILKPPLSARV